jgi:hypothetical protein
VKRRVLFREPVSVAIETLRAHKMRSFLMLLGIILSVSTLIVVIALISGVNQYIADRVANMGSNVFLLTRFPIITDVEEYVKATRRNKKVTWDDFEALRDNMKLPKRVGVELRVDGKSTSAPTLSMTPASAASPPTWWISTSLLHRKAATFPRVTTRVALSSP